MSRVILLRVLAGLSVALGIFLGLWNGSSLLPVIVGLIVGSSFYLSSEIRNGSDKVIEELRNGFDKVIKELRNGFDKVIEELRRGK